MDKEEDQFHVSVKARDGRTSYCKDCTRESAQERRKKNQEFVSMEGCKRYFENLSKYEARRVIAYLEERYVINREMGE